MAGAPAATLLHLGALPRKPQIRLHQLIQTTQAGTLISSWESERERERENANTKTKVRNGGACLSRVKAPTWHVCGNRQKTNKQYNY